ncbi:hypothetical protein I3842_08G046000 [Carya illinoinensis]|uniref:Uncharacterized protein n=1 Tax=Carya illinoinensis TaxID=32201 RepID=A0A922E992_CARIL|nr:hypothetical protein I3842_08G046000 [Carya illinoinensis]
MYLRCWEEDARLQYKFYLSLLRKRANDSFPELDNTKPRNSTKMHYSELSKRATRAPEPRAGYLYISLKCHWAAGI